MARAYSQDVSERVIASVQAGLPSRPAAERLGAGQGKRGIVRPDGRVSRSVPSSIHIAYDRECPSMSSLKRLTHMASTRLLQPAHMAGGGL